MSSTEHRGTIIERVLGWLRAGYPQGVPQQDYVALLGVLRRRLTSAEIEQVAADLAEQDSTPTDEDGIREAIRAAVLQQPTDEDVRRVQAHLAAGGWPLAGADELLDDDRRTSAVDTGQPGTQPQ